MIPQPVIDILPLYGPDLSTNVLLFYDQLPRHGLSITRLTHTFEYPWTRLSID